MGVFRKVIVAARPQNKHFKSHSILFIYLPQILKYFVFLLMAISITDITQEIINTFNPLWHRHIINRDVSNRIERFKHVDTVPNKL